MIEIRYRPKELMTLQLIEGRIEKLKDSLAVEHAAKRRIRDIARIRTVREIAKEQNPCGS